MPASAVIPCIPLDHLEPTCLLQGLKRDRAEKSGEGAVAGAADQPQDLRKKVKNRHATE